LCHLVGIIKSRKIKRFVTFH